MKTIVLVACGKRKQQGSHLAKDLYASPRFRSCRAIAEQYGDLWYVLSAKHGLVDPEASLEFYEQSMKSLSAAERREWQSRTIHALSQIVEPHDIVVFLAGLDYRRFVEKAMFKTGARVVAPIRGYGYPDVAWISQNLAQRSHSV